MTRFLSGKTWGVFALAAVLVATLAVLAPQPAAAQSAASATILGTITDPQGNSVPDATVVAKNVDTGIERSTTTSAEGLYRIPNLPPGTYDLSVAKPGFAKALAKGLHIDVGDQRDVNFKLALAGVTQEVMVAATTPLVETTRTDVSQVVDDKLMADLPITTNGAVGPTNDYAQLAVTVPGVRFDTTGNSLDLIGPGAYSFRGNLYNVDGGNILDQVVTGRDALGASVNEVKEFQVITSSYNAEYGQAGSLIVNVITKSGTNDVHGQAWSYFRGRNLSASNFFYNLTPDSKSRRAPFQKQEWGANAGGPFVKDRAFWFVNYEKTHVASPLTLFPGGVGVTVTQPTNEVLFTVKTDLELSKQHHLTARFNAQRQFFDNDQVQVPSFAAPESLTFFGFHDHMLNLGLTSNFTPHVVNEARFFWHRFLNVLPTKSTKPGQLGPSFYVGAAFCCPQGGLQNRYEYIDNLTWVRGTHTIKGGFNVSHFPYFSLFQQFHFGRYEGFPAGTTIGPNDVATALPTAFTIGVGPGAVTSNDDIYGFYAQDSWKIKPNLTLNYGLRYDLEVGAFRGGTIRDPLGAGSVCFQSNKLISACSSDHNNFQPRLGLAWSPNFQSGFLHTLFGDQGRSVIRASAAEVTEMAFLNVVLDSLNFDGNTLLTVTIRDPAFIAANYPNEPPASAIQPFVPANRTFFGRVRPISPNLHNPEFHHFSLTIDRQFLNDYVFEVGYIGVLGTGQFGERDLNAPRVIPDPAHAGFFYFGPRPNSSFAAIRTNENSRTSAYHGLVTRVTKRLSHHFQAQAGYTFSKTLSSTEDFYGTSEPGDPRNIRAERSLAQNDIRHLGNFGLTMDTVGAFPNSFWRRILGNWTMGWVGQLHSGNPYPVSTGDAGFAGDIFPGVGAETQQRPNVLPDGTIIATNIASNSGSNLEIGPNGATACACPATTFLAPTTGPNPASPNGPVDSINLTDLVDFQFVNGNLGRNVGKGDPFYRFDVSLSKSFHFFPKHENWLLQFRADFFNIFNHTNFTLTNGLDTLNLLPIGLLANGQADPNCTACIRATGPLAGRYIGSDGRVLHIQDLQHGRISRDILNPIFGAAGGVDGLGDPSSADVPREIQLSIHIKW